MCNGDRAAQINIVLFSSSCVSHRSGEALQEICPQTVMAKNLSPYGAGGLNTMELFMVALLFVKPLLSVHSV